MNKSKIPVQPQYFDRYIDYVPDLDIITALEKFGAPYLNLEITMLGQIGHKVYAMDKWTIRDILQHVIDTERIFAYRALRIARNDKTLLPGFDENIFAAHAHASTRKLEDIVLEFDAVRHATTALFKSFNNDDLMREGFVFRSDISVLAIGYVIAGHLIHHLNVIRDRYYPLIDTL
jgi:hypothetical protein